MNAVLDRCPDCQYRLNGLPARYRCPECGYQYDEFTRVWRVRRPNLAYLGLMLNFLYLLQFLGPSGMVINWYSVPALVTGTLLLFYSIWKVFHANERGRFVAIGPNGLAIRDMGETEVFGLHCINEVKGNKPITNLVQIEFVTPDKEIGKRIRRLLISRDAFVYSPVLSVRDADDFVREMNDAIRRHRAASDSMQAGDARTPVNPASNCGSTD